MCADLDLSSTCPEGREHLQSLFPAGAPVCWGDSDQTPGYTAQDGWRPAGPQFNTESSPDNRGHTHTHTQTGRPLLRADEKYLQAVSAIS